MQTPSDFYSTYLGKVIDYDGAYGAQCVDAWKVFCNWASIPVKATPNNWADGYWYYRDQLGYSTYFTYVTDDFQDGDWVMWAKGSASHPSSHIAMFYHNMEFSENQGGNGGFTLKATTFNDALGAFRWKGWAGMNIEKGYHKLSYNGIVVDIIRATAANGYRLHLISAEDNHTDLSYALKDLMEFDSDKLAIVGAVNANYFEMANGMHLGCEGDGWTGGYFQAPKTPGVLAYYITKDGAVGAHDQSAFWLSQDDIQMVCAPYAVLIHQGKTATMHSESFGSKDLVRNTQTAAMKIEDDWCLAIFSECYPIDVQQFALEAGANELLLMDSGGSTQMFECATTGKRKQIRHTSRRLPNVLVLAKEIDGPEEPEPIEEPVTPDPEPEPIDDPKPVIETPDTPVEEEAKGIFGMSNKVYDILKFIAQIVLPAAGTLVVTLGNLWGLKNVEQIAGTIIAIDTFLGAVLQISTNVYNKNKDAE